MATITETGNIDVVRNIVSGSSQKVLGFNTNDQAFLEGIAIATVVTLAAEAGTIVLNAEQSRSGLIDVAGSATANFIVEVSTTVAKTWWVRDRTTGGFQCTLRPTGLTGVLLPKNQWTGVRRGTGGGITYYIAPSHEAEANAAITMGTNYANAGGRKAAGVSKIWEHGTVPGGQAILSGSVSKSVAVPANGDVMLTVPANHRPTAPLGFLGVVDPATNGAATPVALELLTNGQLVLRNVLAWTPATGVAIDFSLYYLIGN